MDEATRASLIIMGDPYAKLSILDEEELGRLLAQLADAKRRRSNIHNATQPSLFEMQNPYAKLSMLSEEELESADRQEQTDLLWKTRTKVYEYVRETFSLSMVEIGRRHR
jgi:hypothetical protein